MVIESKARDNCISTDFDGINFHVLVTTHFNVFPC